MPKENSIVDEKVIVTIASGKGGTGKTTVAANMALSLEDVQLLDCDVEEPNIHLLLRPRINEEKIAYIPIPHVDEDLCNHCGKCSEFCQYNAIFVGPKEVLLFKELCHSCGGCTIICPKKAIREEKHRIGTVKFGSAGNVEVVYGELDVGEPVAVPLIREVKKQIKSSKNVILDSPPGTSCPLIETVRESDFCILVTEPTPFGLHDLKITVQVLKNLAIPLGVIVNRADIGDRKVYDYCKENRIPVLLEISYERRIAELYSKGVPFSSKMPKWKEEFRTVYDKVRKLAEK